MSPQVAGGINLQSIDQAYGRSADLYKDVLGVKANATPEQIQKAYFSRRNELLALLKGMEHDDQDSITASHHFHAKRKMQAVQATVRLDIGTVLETAGLLASDSDSHFISRRYQMRILGDPELRLHYDDIRHERLDGASRKKHKKQSANRARSSTRHGSPTEPAKTQKASKKQRLVSPENQVSRPPATYKYKMEDDDDTRNECSTVDQTYDEDQTIVSEATNRTEGTLMVHQPGVRGVIGRMKDEVIGAVEDTMTSFAQVLNVFTLQDEDIKAVTKRIDKATRQMKTSL
jgi:hypothetical protein